MKELSKKQFLKAYNGQFVYSGTFPTGKELWINRYQPAEKVVVVV